MTTLQRCLEFLEHYRVNYSHTSHPVAYTAREVASAEHVPPHKLAKTVVYFGDRGYGMAVVAADHFVDLEELRRSLELKQVRLASETELGTLFPESELGAMPPFGSLFGMPVCVDAELADEEFIVLNAGTHRDVIHLSFGDFQRLVHPMLATIARQAEPAAV